MAFFYHFLELFATFVEGAIVLLVSTNLAGKKYGTKKNSAYILIASIIYTVIITLLNNWQVFSFVTLGLAILYTFVVILFLSDGKLLYKLCSIMMTWFFINVADYILSYSLIMILGKSLDISAGIPLILSPGTARSVYILVNKSLQIIVFFAFRKLYPKLRMLNQRSIALLLSVVTVAYIVMSVITNLIISSSVILLQIAIIFSVFFIAITIVSVIISIAIGSKYQNEKREKELLTLANSMMEKNYTEIKSIQNTISKQVHDFKNHLRTIDGMLPDESEVKEYLSDLLETSYQQSQNCNCGNEVIDSIINCKISQAALQNTSFKHRIQLNNKLNISPVDICAILANQIDNALEACAEIPATESKYVNVDIWQKESFTFFKVVNSANKNPFDSHGKLETAKSDKKLHGFGIKSIQETANKHNGYLKNEYVDGAFISLVMISSND